MKTKTCKYCGKEYTDFGGLDICYYCFNSPLIKEIKMEKHKLINVKLKDGTVVPIGNPEDYELIINEHGFGEIKIKNKVELTGDDYWEKNGLKE